MPIWHFLYSLYLSSFGIPQAIYPLSSNFPTIIQFLFINFQFQLYLSVILKVIFRYLNLQSLSRFLKERSICDFLPELFLRVFICEIYELHSLVFLSRREFVFLPIIFSLSREKTVYLVKHQNIFCLKNFNFPKFLKFDFCFSLFH